MRWVVGTLTVLLVGLISAAEASRAHMPMGYYVRRAGLIVIAGTHRGGQRGHDTILSVGEVLQGDPKWVGKTITIEQSIRSTADARVPAETVGVAVLLEPQWQTAQRWPVLEAYQKPEELKALRQIVEIYRKPRERERLVALGDLFAEGNPICREQLFADFRQMKDPGNFDLITKLYPALDPPNQRKLVDLLGQIGDQRGVPTLIEAMTSPDQQVSAGAAAKLFWTFPGAPGVTEAFEQALSREHLGGTAARYLLKRRDDPALRALIGAKKTLWHEAENLRTAGDQEAAKVLYLRIIEDAKASDYTRRQAALWILRRAAADEKDRICKALLPLLTKDAETENFIYARDAAKILRGLRRPQCLGPLVRLLRWPSSIYRPSVQVATMAIRELGPKARKKAAAQLIERLASASDRSGSQDERLRLLLQLVWLGNVDDFRKAEFVMPAGYRSSWETLQPFLDLDRHDDEGDFLLKQQHSAPMLWAEVRLWVLFRLGDLREARAVDTLVHYLAEEPDWRMCRTASEALVKIGGAGVEREMTKLLTHEDHNRVRRHAIDTLFAIQGERSLALSRRMLSETDFGVPGMACMNLAHFGTPDDLKLLLPLCDYWTADRTTHSAAMSAVAEIRGRYGYDVNGPIKRTLGEAAR